MDPLDRYVEQSPLYVGPRDVLKNRTLDISPAGGAPTSPTVEVFDAEGDSLTPLPGKVTGSATAAGDVITLPNLGPFSAPLRGEKWRRHLVRIGWTNSQGAPDSVLIEVFCGRA